MVHFLQRLKTAYAEELHKLARNYISGTSSERLMRYKSSNFYYGVRLLIIALDDDNLAN